MSGTEVWLVRVEAKLQVSPRARPMVFSFKLDMGRGSWSYAVLGLSLIHI